MSATERVRCERCDVPIASPEDYATLPTPRDPSVRCWQGIACTPVDWRAVALDARRERDALRTERAAREAAEAHHAALAGAVRAEREAREGLVLALQDADNDGATLDRQRDARVAYCAADRAMRAATERLDALLAGAPGGYVPAPVVREYLAAEETMRLVAADDHRRDTYHEWAKRHGAAMDAVDAARTALDAALAAAEGR